MSKITVLGIFVADISFSGPKIPSIGETILGKKYNVGPGGKGCNQAIAIARLGGNTNFISKIGKDAYGELALKTLEKNKIFTSYMLWNNLFWKLNKKLWFYIIVSNFWTFFTLFDHF